MITQARLKERYHYDPETGVFTRLFNRAGAKKGTLVTTKHGPEGHLQITVDRKVYASAKLAWLYVFGFCPTNIVDHKDTNTANDRIANLRLASNSQNCFNCPIRSDNKSGAKGVSLRPNGKYRARITAFGIVHSLGDFNTLEEASAARNEAAKSFHGEFARAG